MCNKHYNYQKTLLAKQISTQDDVDKYRCDLTMNVVVQIYLINSYFHRFEQETKIDNLNI